MSSCLGIYVDKNIIKYAKISREKDTIKVDAFGIKIYTDFTKTIDQIISETFSYKDSISINISGEVYNFMNMSNLLNKKDLNKAIETEFESICNEKKINVNALESRYVLTNNFIEKDSIRVIHVSEDKIKINKIIQDLPDANITNITPIALTIPNIASLDSKQNSIIVNIEDETIVSIVKGKSLYDIQKINLGTKKILDNINVKENSYAKAYEICKNTTIYTSEGVGLQEQNDKYLEEIIPVLYNISTNIKEIISLSPIKINKVYLTGTASVINNIDLYFEEVLGGIECEILKPFFLENNPKINIKDYIEVNSAISLALQGLNYGIKNINFNKKKFNDQFMELMKLDVSIGGKGKKKNSKSNVKFNFNLDNVKIKKWLFNEIAVVLILGIVYIGSVMYIQKGIDEKNKEISDVKEDIDLQISKMDSDKNKIELKKSKYSSMISNLENVTSTINDKKNYKNAITTFLSEMQNIIPKEVQLISIENTSEKNITIKAQSPKYEQLAYFKALLKSNAILEPSSVVSSSTQKDGENIKITIEGVLP